MVNFLFNVQIIIIAALAALSCAIPGVFLIVRGMALMSDAMSHSVLLGMVIAFLIFKDLGSPFIFVGAVMAAVGTVFCTEKIIASNKLKKDAAVGLVFPLFFSIAVFLISQYARSVHLDTDMILVGEIAFAPLNKLVIGSWNFGPRALWILLAICLINCFVVFVFFRAFKVTIFDPHAAKMFGYNQKFLHYLLMLLMSCTTVVVFDIVGAIICVALTIVPGATAFLYVKKLEHMFFLTAVIAIIMGSFGAMVGIYFDVSIAGAISTVAGILFLMSVIVKTAQHYI